MLFVHIGEFVRQDEERRGAEVEERLRGEASDRCAQLASAYSLDHLL